MSENIKPDKPRRTKRLPDTRATDAEYFTIMDRVKNSGLSFSEFQRQALMNGVVIIRDNAIDRQSLNGILAIGNNLNQLVRKEHIHDKSDTQKMRDILVILEEVIIGLMNDTKD